jgi:hypothetical protein
VFGHDDQEDHDNPEFVDVEHPIDELAVRDNPIDHAMNAKESYVRRTYEHGPEDKVEKRLYFLFHLVAR